MKHPSWTIGVLAAPLWFGCNNLIGLDDFSVPQQVVLAQEATPCAAHSDCFVPGVQLASCNPTTHVCQPLFSEDCTAISGDLQAENSVLLGSLFSLDGAQAATNLQRQQSAALAVEQINAAGGVPSEGTAPPRPLALLSCNETSDVVRAATHLADLGVAAIIGPNTSQDTLRASAEVTIPRGIAVLTPTAVASSIGDLIDNDLTFQMAPTDIQRAPLMIQQIEAIAADLEVEREGAPVRLGIVFRNDALGIGTRTSLNALTLNQKPLSDPTNLGTNVTIDGYEPSENDRTALIQSYVAFAPDIIAMAGTAEAVTQIMIPLEAAWTAEHRPEYVLIDSLKVPELLAACRNNQSLSARIRGTGLTQSAASTSIYEAFQLDYRIRYGEPATASGAGASYDAAFAVALALAATKQEPVSGTAISRGLRRLSGGPEMIGFGATRVLAAFRALSNDGAISAVGSFASLGWNADGTVKGSTIEMWCVGVGETDTPHYQSSGLTFDIDTQARYGEFVPCVGSTSSPAPQLAMSQSAMSQPMRSP